MSLIDLRVEVTTMQPMRIKRRRVKVRSLSQTSFSITWRWSNWNLRKRRESSSASYQKNGSRLSKNSGSSKRSFHSRLMKLTLRSRSSSLASTSLHLKHLGMSTSLLSQSSRPSWQRITRRLSDQYLITPRIQSLAMEILWLSCSYSKDPLIASTLELLLQHQKLQITTIQGIQLKIQCCKRYLYFRRNWVGQVD